MHMKTILAVVIFWCPAAALAHPHVFVEAEVEVIYGANGPEAVRLEWTYDEFFTLLMTEELQIDSDLDGELTESEMDVLRGFVLDWPEGYEGDLFVRQNGADLRLGERREASVSFTGGVMREVHVRPILGADAGDLSVQVYDPGFYTAYSVSAPVTVSGAPCRARIAQADLVAAQARVDGFLANMTADEAEIFFPEVGAYFADTIEVRCD